MSTKVQLNFSFTVEDLASELYAQLMNTGFMLTDYNLAIMCADLFEDPVKWKELINSEYVADYLIEPGFKLRCSLVKSKDSRTSDKITVKTLAGHQYKLGLDENT